jgi:hypothetical protein
MKGAHMQTLMTFEQFKGQNPIFNRLNDIQNFALIVETPPFSLSDSDSLKIMTLIYDHLRKVVSAANFFYEDQLRMRRGPDQITIEYGDDRFSFSVSCRDRSIVIERNGSHLRNFHDWYIALMPSAPSIITRVAEIMSLVTDQRVDILRASYQYNFLIYDIIPENGSGNVRNSVIMQKLLKGYPDDSGIVTDTTEVLSSVARADVSITRWIRVDDNWRSVRFKVEAPSNKNGTGLWFTFEYRGESYTSPETGIREAFSPQHFLNDYEAAYTKFLRDTALARFMESLLKGYIFRSSAHNLP